MNYAGCVESRCQTEPMDDFKPIAYAARVIWALGGTAIIAIVGLPIAVYTAFINHTMLLAVVPALALIATWWFWISGRRWRAWGYAERDKDLVLRRGVLVRRLTIVPYGRMQFVDVTQGPLERILGVSTVVLNTAAAATDARIPMLKDEEAHRLRDQLTQLGETYAKGL